MHKQYTAVFAGIGTEQIDIAFPDFPGCVSVASNLEEAYHRAADVLSFHVQSMVDDGDPIPCGCQENAVLDLVREYEAEGFQTVTALISITIPSGKARRINVTLPEYVLEAADHWAKKHGQSRSGLLASATMDYLTRHP